MKKFTWQVKITVDGKWVEDGFDLTKDRVHDIMMNALPYAHGSEIKVSVVSAPTKKDIRVMQGYAK